MMLLFYQAELTHGANT